MQPALLLDAAPHLSAQWRRHYLHRLARWFTLNRRDLPWRRTHDAYAIWLSESMLQQTQVATVIDYYERFLRRFPNVHSLAEADEPAVLAMWAGLGYYRRARQLHAAARQIVAQHAGVFPSDVESLMQLPGVGRYTAGAIASIAFDKAAPIVEANTERLFARLLCLRDSPKSPRAGALLWQFAEWHLPRANSGSARLINQAAMELGSLVCKPLRPACPTCPLVKLCPTAQQGFQSVIPPPKPKKTFTSLHHVALVIAQQGRWLVRINAPGAWWTGLWDFPRVDVTSLGLQISHSTGWSNRSTVDASIEEAALHQLGLPAQVGAPLFTLSHGVTRYRIKLDCVEATAAKHSGSGWLWGTSSELAQLPLTAPARKILDRLCT